MSDETIGKALQDAYRTAEGKPPPFDAVWAAAEARHATTQRRFRVVSGLAAAAAVMAITVIFWPGQQAEMTDEFLIADALMNSTSWTAPSDALMPDHQFDIYQGIPLLDASTISQEGSLL